MALRSSMATGAAGAIAGVPSAGQGMQAPSINGMPLQPLQTNAKPATAVQENANQFEQIRGGTALNLNNEFQIFLTQSVGRALPMYGYNLFDQPPSTFAPAGNTPAPHGNTPAPQDYVINPGPAPHDYVIGPGDEIVLTGWGQGYIDMRVTVDRNGAINLPKVGTVNVTGIKY